MMMDDVAAAAAGRAVQLPGHGKHAASKDQQFRVGVCLNGAYFPRAREAGADTPSSVSRPTRAQTDPLAPPGRRLADVADSFLANSF
jgi:hypothetical protein